MPRLVKRYSARADVIFLAGYIKRLGPRTLAAFPSRILNTHLALLPKFGGQAMFGDRAFEAVLAEGEPKSGASAYLVDAVYDTGAVVRQERIRVLPGDTVESLKARVQACEREAVVQTLAAIASGELILGRPGAMSRRLLKFSGGSVDMLRDVLH
jgi:phosphoribosylglycinamide formyltransferase 1